MVSRQRRHWRTAATVLAAALLLAGCTQPSMTRDQWWELVVKADRPVLVEFSRPECSGCKVLGPRLAMMATEYGDRVGFFKINTNTSWDLVEQNNIRRLPAVLLFINGRETKRWEGVLDIAPYRKAVNEALDGKAAK